MLKNIYRFLSSRYQNVFLDYKVEMRPRYGHGLPPHKELYDIINKNRSLYREILADVMLHQTTLAAIQGAGVEKDASKPVWNNGFLPGLDIISIYTLIAK